MKTSLLPLAGILPAALVAPLFAQLPGNLTNTTPGSATWTQVATPTGTRTIFTITSDSVFEWDSGFSLTAGNELVFDFLSGNSVVNVLGGTGVNLISGNVTSNGNVSFVSPHADLVVNGNITGKSVTLSTLNADTAALLGHNGTVTFSGPAGSMTGLMVCGSIQATNGDVLLAGQRVTVTRDAQLRAKGSVLMGSGSRVDLDRDSATRKLKATSGDGFVYHLGNSKAARIEIAAGADFLHKGRLEAGRIFLEVGKDGKVLKEGGGIVVGKVEVNGVVQKGVDGGPHDADEAAALNPSTLKMPAITRPNGSRVSESRTVVSNVPVSASADSVRDRKPGSDAMASNNSGKGAKPMLQRASFFGMRGGSETVKAEKKR
ncbi:hypothetical protein [Haloferula sp. BvORR071]|uniref:hypothetical protein n=1 Tax=Haloferula sp. BvORR071 TaxID=1396141 RepID=UPI002240FEBE|nr:hypothetical protein [Haloferula sp. BvORR071]